MTEGPLTASPPPWPRQFGGAAGETNQRRGCVLTAINTHTSSAESDKCSLDQIEASRFSSSLNQDQLDRRTGIDGPESPPTLCVKSSRWRITWEKSLNLRLSWSFKWPWNKKITIRRAVWFRETYERFSFAEAASQNQPWQRGCSLNWTTRMIQVFHSKGVFFGRFILSLHPVRFYPNPLLDSILLWLKEGFEM